MNWQGGLLKLTNGTFIYVSTEKSSNYKLWKLSSIHLQKIVSISFKSVQHLWKQIKVYFVQLIHETFMYESLNISMLVWFSIFQTLWRYLF